MLSALGLMVLASCQTVPPKAVDWSQTVTEAPDGTFVMGNPDAPIKLVEFASLTCPHCATFDAASSGPLAETYVKSGKVSYSIHNFVRDPFDVAASIIARCGGAKYFYPMTHAILAAQPEWTAKMMALPQDQLEALQAKTQAEQMLAIGQASGLQDLAASNGLPVADTTRCLSDVESSKRLIAMRGVDAEKYPDIVGVPSFIINGTLVAGSTWPEIEAKLR